MEPNGLRRKPNGTFSKQTCILDWPHLWRTILNAVRTVGLQREEGVKLVTAQSEQLLERADRASARALTALAAGGRGYPKVKALQAAITYLKTRRDWISNYEEWKRQEYPVGSRSFNCKNCFAP